MKRNAFVLSICLLFAGALQSNAQGFHLGIKAGADMDKFDGKSFADAYHFGYNVGAFAELNFTPWFGLQPEFMFAQGTFKTGHNFSDIFPGGFNDLQGKLGWIEIPVLLSFKPIPLISIQLGPQYAILVNSDQHLVDNAGDAFKKGDLSILGGVQLNLASLKVGARYSVGLSDMNNYNSQGTWRWHGYQLYAGFRIF